LSCTNNDVAILKKKGLCYKLKVRIVKIDLSKSEVEAQ